MAASKYNEAYLIAPSFIREFSNVNANIDDKWLYMAIREAQQIDLQQIIGTSLLQKLADIVFDGTYTKAENSWYNELIILCRYFLLYNVLKRLVVIISQRISNAGVTVNKDETYESRDFKDVFQLSNWYGDRADFYTKQVQYYILNNIEHYPELDKGTEFQLKSQLKSSAKTNMFLGGARGKRKIPTELRDDKYIIINK